MQCVISRLLEPEGHYKCVKGKELTLFCLQTDHIACLFATVPWPWSLIAVIKLMCDRCWLDLEGKESYGVLLTSVESQKDVNTALKYMI